jgi:hypothetical protein
MLAAATVVSWIGKNPALWRAGELAAAKRSRSRFANSRRQA